MKYTLACKDLGMDCNWKGEEKSKEELLTEAVKHAKKVHKYTDEQLNDPKMMKAVDSAIKEHS